MFTIIKELCSLNNLQSSFIAVISSCYHINAAISPPARL